MKNERLENKFKGCLMGSLIGDSLAPELGIGYYTDDTQQTKLIAETIIENKGFDPEKFIEKLVNFKEAYLGWGPNTIKIVNIMQNEKKKGLSYNQIFDKLKTFDFGNAGNGSAMRISPIGLFYSDNIEELKKATIDSSIVTHNDSKAKAGALAISYAVAKLLKTESNFNVNDFIDDISAFVKEENGEMANKILNVKNYLNKNLKEAAKSIGVGGYIIKSVPFAIYGFANSPNDFKKTLENMINAKGDTDSNAAIACALSGAFNGYNKIPTEILNKLPNISGGKEEVYKLAKKLYGVKNDR